jgi:hypothetical protein
VIGKTESGGTESPSQIAGGQDPNHRNSGNITFATDGDGQVHDLVP